MQAERIIDAFADIEQTNYRLCNYVCKSVAVGMEDDGRLGVYMSLEGGVDRHEVQVCGTEIDPSSVEPEDLINWAVYNYGIEYDEAVERLTGAGVF